MPESALEIESELLRDGYLAGNIQVPEPLNVYKEVRRFRRDPLAELRATLTDTHAELFQGDIGRYTQAFAFYTLSLERVLQHISIGRRWQSEVRHAYGGGRRLTERQKEVSRRFRETRPYCELDFSNCLIHARILLDRTIAFGRRFLTGPRLPSFASFNDHKKFVSRDMNVFGERHRAYCQYIAQSTEWFNMPLKSVRDKLVVHSAPNHIPFLGFGSDHDLEMCFLLDQRNTSKPFGDVYLVKCSVRRLARDIEEFLSWYNDYAVSAVRDTERERKDTSGTNAT